MPKAKEQEEAPSAPPEGKRETRARRDPVDDYPPRPLSEAQQGVVQIIPHDEESVKSTLQLKHEGGELVPIDPDSREPIVNRNYVEETPPGYIAPDYT